MNKLKIYTYTNPYELQEEFYWDEIKNFPHFCVSQTLVNGLKKTIPVLGKKNNITTVRNLINSLYEKWDDIGLKIRQVLEVDNAISKLNLVGEHIESTRKSLLNNARNISDSLRLLSELNLNPFDFNVENLNIDQKYLVDIFKIIKQNTNSNFNFERPASSEAIEEAIKKALFDANERNQEFDLEKIDYDTVIFNGIHQFTPAMLCAIEDILKYKNVILIFNYQKQYKGIYSTWLKIYSLFNVQIQYSQNEEFVPNILTANSSYNYNILADCIGNVVNCEYKEINKELDNIEILEFDNITEFANYVAEKYEAAIKLKSSENVYYASTLKYMSEQFYSPSTKVNDILRAYFPEQFEDKHFLDFPLGHFIIATMNMWDSDEEKIVVNNFSDIKECLNCGIIFESTSGILINTFNQVLPFIEDKHTLEDIINNLKDLHKLLNNVNNEKKKISYFNVKQKDLSELINGLNDLTDIIKNFFVDFKNGKDNFKRFYQKVREFLGSKINQVKHFDSEMEKVVKNLLNKMDKTDIPSTGSFITLRETMSYYLEQEGTTYSRAKWIVRGFEQIDGDILNSNDDNKVYHFACLSDSDICASKDERLPWPLDTAFFEFIQIPLELNYEIFLKSKLEYHNFNLYALLYGLEFCRSNCKLSYIKSSNNKENSVYHILSMLGLKIKKYNYYDKSGFLSKVEYKNNSNVDYRKYVDTLKSIDELKMAICPHKFLEEAILQDHSIFKNRFLVCSFIRVLVRNAILNKYQGQSINQLEKIIEKEFSVFNLKFKCCNELEKIEIISNVYKEIRKKYTYGNTIRKVENKEELDLAEDFLFYTQNKIIKLTKEEIINKLKSSILETSPNPTKCKWCASSDICLAYRGSYND